MALVRQHRALQRRQRRNPAPRPAVVRGVLHREAVDDLGGRSPAEPLDHLGVRRQRRAAAAGRGVEVSGFDHQGVTLPPADGVAHPGLDLRRAMAPVGKPDDPRALGRLDIDHDLVAGLYDLDGVDIDHRRPPNDQAALVQRAVLHPPDGAEALGAAQRAGGTNGGALAVFGGEIEAAGAPGSYSESRKPMPRLGLARVSPTVV